MSLALDHLPGLFGSPGTSQATTKKLLHQVASVHAELLTKTIGCLPELGNGSGSHLLQFLDGPSPVSTKRRFLCHPYVIEALHTLALHSPELTRWHQRVTAEDEELKQTQARQAQTGMSAPPPDAVLGNLALVVRLNIDPEWNGEILLSTDVLGRIGFPFSDWTITLCEGKQELLSSRVICLELQAARVSWRLQNDSNTVFLMMHRDDCLRMIVDNDMLDPHRLQFPHPTIKPQFRLARKIGLSSIRYDPIAFLDFDAHAGLTGGIIQRVLSAIQCNSPGIYHELCSFIHSIRGFEFRPSPLGVVGSFSDPTLPGVMNFNVSYNEDHQPCLDPLCFTWFGHEMGHSKNYLIDTVLFGEGISLVLNSTDRTEVIPRYGRSFTLRTLFQIPYVHLYEWALFMDFLEAGFRGLPWSIPADVEERCEDIGVEIEEAFAQMNRCVQFTSWGQTARDYFHDLYDQAKVRWQTLRARVFANTYAAKHLYDV